MEEVPELAAAASATEAALSCASVLFHSVLSTAPHFGSLQSGPARPEPYAASSASHASGVSCLNCVGVLEHLVGVILYASAM